MSSASGRKLLRSPRHPGAGASSHTSVLGIMSGTSLDAVDLAVCRPGTSRPRLLEFLSVPMPSRLRRRLAAAARGEADVREVARLHHDFGRFTAGAAAAMRDRVRFDAVGWHGQTVYHAPSGAHATTFQLGEAAYLAEALRCPVVSNFRAGDLAAGGQAAPLATAFHLRIFGRPGRHVCALNLGGIANVTSMDATVHPERLLSFDTGPANMLLDLFVQRISGGRHLFDRDGRLSGTGRVLEGSLARWMRDPFLRKAPPKSTGRERYGESFLDRVFADPALQSASHADVAATLLEFTARSVALNFRLFLPSPPSRVIVCGGGALNPVLLERLRIALGAWHPPIRVQSCLDAGWIPQAIEPAAFALLAWLRLRGLPGNLPDTTGARHPALLGQVTQAWPAELAGHA